MRPDFVTRKLRRRIVEIVTKSGEGHIPSAFSIVDILYASYSSFLDVSLENLESADRDYFVLSKGHGAAALYVVLEEFGILPKKDVDTYGTFGSLLGGHPDTVKVSGVEASTGSLGHGLPIAVGITMGLRIRDIDRKVVALLGDGECQEGTVWEAAHVAANQRLNNLIVIVDRNMSGAQLTPIDDLPAKWKAFGWTVTEVDGHSHADIVSALEESSDSQSNSPHAIIANTVKGKGVSLLEGHGVWHHRIPVEKELEVIYRELS